MLTIGASNHSLEHFLDLLREHQITVVADVRSVPASRYTPQFNQEPLRAALNQAGIHYVFLGKELGARSSDPRCYVDGKVQYRRLAQTPDFLSGIERLLDGATRERIAIMCTEQKPLECHRTILVSRELADRGVSIVHILGDGSTESHEEMMMQLRKIFGLDAPTLFDDDEEQLTRALALQEAKIAYVDQELVAG